MAGVVGRQSEIAAVEAFLAGDGGGPRALAIVGAPGIGKTTVWQAGVDRARATGYRVLSARPSGAEASLSFAGLADLLAPVDRQALSGLAPPQRHALDVALLREEAGGQRVDARAVATATWSLLAGLATEGPTVLAVDDAQWLDGSTHAALRFALRRLENEPLAVLCAVRLDGERAETFESALEPDRRVELPLTPLSVAAMHEVIDARLGGSLRRPALVKVVQHAAGNAFYAIEIAREWLRLGLEEASLPIPAGVHALVAARVARLPSRSRDALLLASALAVPTTALVSDDDLLPAEDEALVRVERDGRIRFEHPLVAAAVYESASAARRRRAHRVLAERVEDREGRARHLALAAVGPDDSVAAVVGEAAAHAAARGASASAAELGRLALELTEEREGEGFACRSLAAAHYLLDAGDTAAARAVLEECDLATIEGDLRAELLRELGYVLWYERDFGRGYRLLVAALEHARDPVVTARVHRDAAWVSQEIDLARAIAHDEAALGLLDPEQTPGVYSQTMLHAAYLRLLDGQGADDDAYRRGRELQERGVDWGDVSPVVGMWPLLGDDFALAKGFYEDGLERSRAEGDEPSVQGTLVRLTEIACWTGDLATADRLAAEGVELAHRIGSSAYLGSALYARGLVDAHLGRVEEARAAGERIVELFSGAETQSALGHWVLGFLALSLDDPTAADEYYGHAAAIVATLGQREPARFRFHPDHVEAVVRLGDFGRARALLDALEERARRFPRPWILATGARCRAVLLAAEGDQAAALAAVEESLEHHERLEMPFERARTLLVAGRILRRLRQKRRARDALEEAGGVFGALGAELWARTTRDELKRVAVRRAPDELSATELRIAQLAAAGRSNAEIAAEAFVSRKTVEANLARAYRKLGIRSRAQLARALDAYDAERAASP
jgi:DNA-binding CsgD family transcriptional regulator